MVNSPSDHRPSILCVANWDSDVGYAWWLMESYWIAIERHYRSHFDTLLCYPSISAIPEPIQRSGLTIVSADFRMRRWATFVSQIRFLLTYQIDTIYFSDQPLTSLRYLLFRTLGVRNIIVHDHTPGLRTTPTGLKKQLKLLLRKIPLINADAVIGATDFVRDRSIRSACFPAHKCFAAENGLPGLDSQLEAIEADPYKDFNIPTGRRIFVNTSRANRYKGIDFALQVFAELLEYRPEKDFHFLMFGDGPDLESIKAYASELGLEEFASFPGYVKNVKLYLSKCYAAIHPSRGEVGYSLSILEYMHEGLAVILPDNPSVSSCLTDGHDGLIYEERNLGSAREVMTKLLNNPHYRDELGENARETVINRYRLENSHRALLHALDTIVTQDTANASDPQNPGTRPVEVHGGDAQENIDG